MNTNTKYYTPELHEFHVGFEFEREVLDDDFNHLGWSKETVTIDTNLRKVQKWANYQRAKCLDREDIESLGWKQVGYDNFTLELKDHTFVMEFNPEYKTFIYRDCLPQENYFQGEIKNKNELQKLMVQLNIKE